LWQPSSCLPWWLSLSPSLLLPVAQKESLEEFKRKEQTYLLAIHPMSKKKNMGFLAGTW
jgi:hypothetical protein